MPSSLLCEVLILLSSETAVILIYDSTLIVSTYTDQLVRCLSEVGLPWGLTLRDKKRREPKLSSYVSR
jgi:hypothetical protein